MMLMQLLFPQSIASHLGYAFVDAGAKLPVELCADIDIDESLNADVDRTHRSQEWVES